jgi:hypothetical protein
VSENSPLIRSQPGADILRGASATHSDASVLQKAASGSNLAPTEASIWRMSVQMDIGAPWSTKMGTIRSPCPHDAVARHALQSANLRLPAILYYASMGRGLPTSIASGYPLLADVPIYPGIDAMGHEETSRLQNDTQSPLQRR